jgi:hypothetical protein
MMATTPQSSGRTLNSILDQPIVESDGSVTPWFGQLLLRLINYVGPAPTASNTKGSASSAVGKSLTTIATMAAAQQNQSTGLLGTSGTVLQAIQGLQQAVSIATLRAPQGVVTLANGALVSDGYGSPVGLVPGTIGDLYLQRDGSTAGALWIMESGTPGNTSGWVAITQGVTQIVAGTNVTVSPGGGTGVVTVNAVSSGVTQIVAGTNVTVSPGGGTGVVTVNSTGGGGGGATTFAFSAGSTVTFSGASYFLTTSAAAVFTNGVRTTISGRIRRANTSQSVAVGVATSGGTQGYFLNAQSDGHVVFYSGTSGGNSVISTLTTGGGNVASWYLFRIDFIPDATLNMTVILQLEQIAGGYITNVSTYNLTSGSYYPVVLCNVVADIGEVFSTTGTVAPY